MTSVPAATSIPSQSLGPGPLKGKQDTIKEPSPTLYIRNLNEKKSLNALKDGLQTLFSQFGSVLEIKVKRNLRMRGQAFVSFESSDIATNAMNALQAAPLFDKLMDIQYAKEQSFVISERDGSLEQHKAKRKLILEQRATQVDQDKVKRVKQKNASTEQLPPNAILFVQNLPVDISSQPLENLFKQFSGFKEVRTVPGKPDIAFVEYVDEVTSAVAKQALHRFRLNDHEIKVTFAKK